MKKITLGDCVQKDIKKDKFYNNSMMTTGTSLPFKSTSRQNKPAWGNRIVKDFYNLEYTINTDQFSNQSNKKITSLNQFKKTSIIDIAKSKSKQKSLSIQSSKFKNIDKKYLNKYSYTTPHSCKVETIKMENNPYSTVDTSGLCQFQYKNTIQGRLKYRTNHHLAFEGQPSRKINQYKIWYNPQLTYSHEYEKKKKNKRGKLHSFSSYTERRVFQPKETVDKFYQIEQSWRKTSPIRIKRTVQIKKLSGRKQQKDHFSKNLYLKYDIKKGQYKTRKRPYSFSISRSIKEFEFSKEIINHQRGCFR